MRSKWLEWTPEVGSVGFDGSISGDSPIIPAVEMNRAEPPSPVQKEIIEKTCECEPTKPTEPVHTTQSGRSSEGRTYFWDGHDDAYGLRAQVAIDAICATQAPEGLIVWLDEHSPSLYERLTSVLPDEISRTWNARIRFEEFDALCCQWVKTFQRGAELYSNSKQTPNLFEQREITEGECGP